MPDSSKVHRTTNDWELEEHIDGLKDLKNRVACEAAVPVSNALIFFGRQLYDLKVEFKQLQQLISDAIDSSPERQVFNFKVPRSFGGLLAAGASVGIPAPMLIFLWFVGQSRGWW